MANDIAGMTERQKSLAFFTLITALVLEIVDVTIINTALPAMQADFAARGQDLGGDTAQWIAAGYSLAESLDEGDHSHFAFGSPKHRHVGSQARMVSVQAGEKTEWRIVYAPPSSAGGN